MKIKGLVAIALASVSLTAYAAMDSQNTAKVPPKPVMVEHTHPENACFYAVTHSHGPELGGPGHNHGKVCGK